MLLCLHFQAKKETKQLQQYEEKLVTHYKKFTTILAKLIRGEHALRRSNCQDIGGRVRNQDVNS